MTKLEKYLIHNSITQLGFAKRIGTSANNLNRWIKKKVKPCLWFAYEIEKATGGMVTMYDWIDEDQKKLKPTDFKSFDSHVC